ncbi:uncharacterized protein LOC110608387 [Manihot esculenta]|uniref:uncharacterized protein LOC110608387 n=1 Tax=Manihot esculenta TaxID=3983 RepID=UPI000B5D5260|nr:uncharacterized protein LOC110608387 [Manihot esculenta]
MAIRSILERMRKEIVSDYVDHLGWWDWARLEDFLPASALLSILNHPPPAPDLDQDSIIWKFTSSEQYTVKSVYKRQVVVRLYHWVGRACILSAELKAILYGVRVAKQCGFRKVIVESDNLEAIHMLNVVSEVHRNYNSIICAIRDLLESGDNFSFIHGTRESNQCADKLAKIDAASGGPFQLLEEPPSELFHLIDKDCSTLSNGP